LSLKKLSRLELQIMETLWAQGACSVREIQQRFSEKRRPAYTTVQTMVYRLEAKKAVRRVGKIRKADTFEAAITRKAVHRRLIDELLGVFGGLAPVMSHLIESGRLTLDDIREAEKILRSHSRKDKSQ
jgi:predicted transcriptional regulator